MNSKIILALFSGMLITFIVDFFLFLGIKQNYFDFYEIDIFYNTLFADNQNFIIFFILSALFGFIVIFIAKKQTTLLLLGILSISSIAPLFSSVGNTLGEMMFLQKNKTFQDAHHTFHGDIYYDGRTTIHFFDNDLKRIIILQKDKLQQ